MGNWWSKRNNQSTHYIWWRLVKFLIIPIHYSHFIIGMYQYDHQSENFFFLTTLSSSLLMFGQFICNYEAAQPAILDIESKLSGNLLPYSNIINQSELSCLLKKKRKNSIDPYILYRSNWSLEKRLGLNI